MVTEVYYAIAVAVVVIAAVLYKKHKEKEVKEVPQGLQVFDENGNCVVDLTERIGKYLGTFTVPINADSGTIVNSEIGDGDLWYAITVDTKTDGGVSTGDRVVYSFPVITKGNGMLTWRYPHSQDGITGVYRRYGVTVHYGVY